jgi:hypothetical protein
MQHGSDLALTSWGTLIFLGAFHGVNPGMGWLFAVALGLQENRGAAVWRALLPLGIGHACAIAVTILAGIVAGIAIPPALLRWPVAVLLVLLGVQRLRRHRHPRWAGMRISMGGLTIWSFLVATAHGAGLMVLPVWLHISAVAAAQESETFATHGRHLHTASLMSGLAATAVHGASYLLVTATIAWLVFTRLGVGLLRTAWINLDVIWAVALIVTGGLTLVVPGM